MGVFIIMGQKLIISEEEQKHIRGLYESAPPPSEREIVIRNENPFKKYSDYEDARREYSPNLKNGDRFYVTKHFGNTIGGLDYDRIVHSNKNILELYESIFMSTVAKFLINKTIRTVSDDNILRIERVGVFKDTKTHKDVLVLNFLKTNQGFDINKGLKITEDGVTNLFGQNLKSELMSDLTQLIELSRKLLLDLQNKIKYFSKEENYSEIGDDYFDIYKIKRQQTDF